MDNKILKNPFRRVVGKARVTHHNCLQAQRCENMGGWKRKIIVVTNDVDFQAGPIQIIRAQIVFVENFGTSKIPHCNPNPLPYTFKTATPVTHCRGKGTQPGY